MYPSRSHTHSLSPSHFPPPSSPFHFSLSRDANVLVNNYRSRAFRKSTSPRGPRWRRGKNLLNGFFFSHFLHKFCAAPRQGDKLERIMKERERKCRGEDVFVIKFERKIFSGETGIVARCWATIFSFLKVAPANPSAAPLTSAARDVISGKVAHPFKLAHQ